MATQQEKIDNMAVRQRALGDTIRKMQGLLHNAKLIMAEQERQIAKLTAQVEGAKVLITAQLEEARK